MQLLIPLVALLALLTFISAESVVQVNYKPGSDCSIIESYTVMPSCVRTGTTLSLGHECTDTEIVTRTYTSSGECKGDAIEIRLPWRPGTCTSTQKMICGRPDIDFDALTLEAFHVSNCGGDSMQFVPRRNYCNKDRQKYQCTDDGSAILTTYATADCSGNPVSTVTIPKTDCSSVSTIWYRFNRCSGGPAAAQVGVGAIIAVVLALLASVMLA